MPTPDQSQRGHAVTLVDGRVRLAFRLDHEIGARVFDLSPEEAMGLAGTIAGTAMRALMDEGRRIWPA